MSAGGSTARLNLLVMVQTGQTHTCHRAVRAELPIIDSVAEAATANNTICAEAHTHTSNTDMPTPCHEVPGRPHPNQTCMYTQPELQPPSHDPFTKLQLQPEHVMPSAHKTPPYSSAHTSYGLMAAGQGL